MTIIPTGALDIVREQFRTHIYNVLTPVKKIIANTNNDENPGYAASEGNTLAEYTGFYCSYFNILSGKTDRVFKERDSLEQFEQFGLIDKDAYIIQYISGISLTPVNIGDPARTSDFLVDEQIHIDNNWWIVRKVIPDSEGVQHTVFVVK